MILSSLLNSCINFNFLSNKNNYIDCDKKTINEIDSHISDNKILVSACLKKHNRLQDLDKFEAISHQAIQIKCERRADTFLVLSQHNTNKPNFNLNLAQLSKSPVEKIKAEFFHESLHWLGYEHAKGFDLTNIAEQCCISNTSQSAVPSREACHLLKYSNSQWVTVEYLAEYTEFALQNGFEKLALKTSINAGLQWLKQNKPENMYEAINVVVTKLNRINLKKSFSRIDRKKLENSSQISQSLILLQLLKQSQQEKLIKSALNTYQTLAQRFYPYQFGKEKLLLFSEISNTLNSLLKKDGVSLAENWNKLKFRTEYLCRDLTTSELQGIAELLSYFNLEIFEIKSQIPAGEFYEIATYWTNPCDLHKSLKQSQSTND